MLGSPLVAYLGGFGFEFCLSFHCVDLALFTVGLFVVDLVGLRLLILHGGLWILWFGCFT